MKTLTERSLEDLKNEVQELKQKNDRLLELIECYRFCHWYATSRKSYKYALKLIQLFELPIYRLKKIQRVISKQKNVILATAEKSADNSGIVKYPVKRIAVIIHAYYLDVLNEIYQYIENIPFEFDVYLNVPEGLNVDGLNIHKNLKKLYRLPNIGKDIGSFIQILKDIQSENYDLVLKVHTKKSIRFKDLDGDAWRRSIFNSLMGSKTRVEEIVRNFETQKIGISGTEELYFNFNIREENYNNFKYLLRLLSMTNKNFGYHAGTMFWFKPSAFRKLTANKNVTFDTFRTSKNQDDGDIEHSFERIFALVAMAEGYKVLNYSINALNPDTNQ